MTADLDLAVQINWLLGYLGAKEIGSQWTENNRATVVERLERLQRRLDFALAEPRR